MNVPKAIRELEKIEMVRRNNSYRLDHAVTKKQKTILQFFGLEDYRRIPFSTEISRLLGNNQSLFTRLQDEENESFENKGGRFLWRG